MAMTRRVSRGPAVYFERPTVSARLYVTKGPSGWAETFSRLVIDAELALFLGHAPVADAVDAFMIQRELSEDKKPEDWHTVIGFLGRLLEISPLDVPPEVGIAFWGRIELARHEQGTN